MKALVFYVMVLSGLACVRAQLSPVDQPVDQKDSSPPKDALACFKPVTGCTSPDGTVPCDPVCQTGTCDDWCSQKCSIAGDGTVGCLSKGDRNTEVYCKISSADLPQQHDNCVPGDICLPIGETGLSYCFQLCHTSLECPGGVGVRCADRPLGRNGTTARVCDPPYSNCDLGAPSGGCCKPTPPDVPASTSAACADGRFCYLVSKDPVTGASRTVCEYTTGISTKGPCSLPSDCAEGYSCDPTGTCRQVCDLSQPSCLAGTCTPNGTQYGFCI